MKMNLISQKHNTKELLLVQRHLATLPKELLPEKVNSIEHLDLSFNRISNFDWIYKFEQLKYLILDCNRLREPHLQKIKKPLPNIKLLMLNKNELTDLSTTALILSRIFPNLEYLSLHGNALCPDGLELQPFSQYICYEYEYYRSQLLCALPKLKFLDHSPIDFIGSVVSAPQREARILKLSPGMLWASLKRGHAATKEEYHALPENPQRHVGYHRGGIRKLSSVDHIYKGTESEGNRFISNNDL